MMSLSSKSQNFGAFFFASQARPEVSAMRFRLRTVSVPAKPQFCLIWLGPAPYSSLRIAFQEYWTSDEFSSLGLYGIFLCVRILFMSWAVNKRFDRFFLSFSKKHSFSWLSHERSASQGFTKSSLIGAAQNATLRRAATVDIPGGRGGEAPAEPMPSSAGASLSH